MPTPATGDCIETASLEIHALTIDGAELQIVQILHTSLVAGDGEHVIHQTRPITEPVSPTRWAAGMAGSPVPEARFSMRWEMWSALSRSLSSFFFHPADTLRQLLCSRLMMSCGEGVMFMSIPVLCKGVV